MFNRLRHSIKITQQDATDAAGKVTTKRSKVYIFPYHHEVTVSRSYDVLTDTAKIVLPKNINLPVGVELYAGKNPIMMRGDIVELSAGYHPNMQVVFKGYISKVNSQIPVTISCEDEMYQLKQQITKENISEKSLTLKKLLTDTGISTTYETKQIEAGLGDYRRDKVTKAFLLQSLRSSHGLLAYFVDKILYVGLASWGTGKKHEIVFERDVYDNNLVFLRSDDIKIKVKGKLVVGNTTTEYDYGDNQGDLRTVYQYGGVKADLDRTCEKFLSDSKYSGYYGTFTTRLEPVMTHGDIVTIKSYKDPTRDGDYLIKSVTLTIGVNGGKQKVELERLLSIGDTEETTQE